MSGAFIVLLLRFQQRGRKKACLFIEAQHQCVCMHYCILYNFNTFILLPQKSRNYIESVKVIAEKPSSV